MERAYSSVIPMGHVDDDYNLVDFMDEANFEHFIALVRGESADPIVKFCPNYLDCDHINDCSVDNQFVPTRGLPYDQFNPPVNTFSDPINPLLFDSLPCDLKEGEGEEEENDTEEYSSATINTTTPLPPPNTNTNTNTNTTTSTKKSTKGDRSRTLISERRRRDRMKEKLYALRALVPNITKMDKASIVGDAALYVQELQMQAKKLRAEIASLESSLTGVDKQQGGGLYDNANNKNIHPTSKKISQIDVFQVEEKGFYVRLVCNKGQGVAASLHKALDSFSSFIVQSSNLATADKNFVLTFTLNVREREMDMNLPNLKLWVAGALLNQGFDF